MSGETAEVVKGAGRPANLLLVAPAATLEEREQRIRTYYTQAGTAYAMSAYYAVMTGFELHAAREQIGHGHWEEWVKEHCPFGPSTAWRLMEASRRKYRQIPNLAHVQDFMLGKAPGDLEPEQRQRLMEAVRDAAAGQTYRQMLLELGLLTDPKARGGDHGGGKSRSELTPDEKRDRAAEQAAEEWAEIEKALSIWCAKRRWQHCDNLSLTKARQTLEAALSLIPKPLFRE